MRIKIIAPTGYGDRYGVFHEFGAVVEMPDAIANKLLYHRLAVAAAERVETPARKPNKAK